MILPAHLSRYSRKLLKIMLISLVLFAGVTVAPHPPKKQKFIYHRQCYMRFLSSNSQILFIMMKYSIPGHSCVQEVDNMHRQVQDVMRISEFYSPLLFLRVLAKSIETNLSRWWLHEFCKASSFSNHTFSKVYQFRFSRDSIYNI